MNQEPKSRYRYRMRPLTDPPDLVEFEAGPFTPLDASVFGQTEAAKRCMITGRAWVCDYAPIVEPAAVRRRVAPRLVTLGALFTIWVACVVTLYQLRVHADEICRRRAKSADNVTLCQGEVYATDIFGETECGCRRAK